MSRLTMADLVTVARVMACLRAPDKHHAVRALARMAADTASIDGDGVLDAVVARTDLPSFGPGRGVAMPHALVPGLEKPLGVFARLEPAVDFGATDGDPADLVLLILGAEGDVGSLLRALACAARRLRDSDLRTRLRSAVGAEAIHAVLTSDAWRMADSVPATLPPRAVATGPSAI